jgi:hypothetical protein
VHVHAHGVAADVLDGRVEAHVGLLELEPGDAQQVHDRAGVDRAVKPAVLVGLLLGAQGHRGERGDAHLQLLVALRFLGVQARAAADHQLLVVLGGHHGQLAREQEVARVAGADAHDVPAAAEALDVLAQEDLDVSHGVLRDQPTKGIRAR